MFFRFPIFFICIIERANKNESTIYGGRSVKAFVINSERMIFEIEARIFYAAK